MARTRILIAESHARRRPNQLRRGYPVSSPTRMVRPSDPTCASRLSADFFRILQARANSPGARNPYSRSQGASRASIAALLIKSFVLLVFFTELRILTVALFVLDWLSAPACCVVRHPSRVIGTSVALLVPRKLKGEDQ